uniref:Uncharacterized protein n=1 Tax=Ciona savignyi TaxID=51511 RepID=H2Y796_CIOSA
VWERRAPLAPSHVRKLVQDGVKVLVQPANKRAFPVQEYVSVGATVQEDLSEASVILGVKQVPIDRLQNDKVYIFFSHTIKAQDENMPMLDAILDKNIRLIDYETMTEENGMRVVAFGHFAGMAGMINILHGIGLRLLALGHHTPFMHIGIAHNYRTSGQAIQAVRDAGYEISMGRLPESVGPLTFVFTGMGNVSQGAQEVFKELPHVYVEPHELKHVAEHGENLLTDASLVYGCVVDMHHHLRRKSDGGFDMNEYFNQPQLYESVFAEEIAPYASCIMNGIFWHASTSPKLSPLLRRSNVDSEGCPRLPHRLIAIGDVSADPGGSIEFMESCTSIDAPFVVYDALSGETHQGVKEPGILICSVDNLPAQLPRESSQFFGDQLFPYLKDIVHNNATSAYEDIKYMSPAIIASNGKLTPKYTYIQELRRKRLVLQAGAMYATSSQNHKVLVLGSGFVSAPLIDYLTRHNDTAVTVGTSHTLYTFTISYLVLVCDIHLHNLLLWVCHLTTLLTLGYEVVSCTLWTSDVAFTYCILISYWSIVTQSNTPHPPASNEHDEVKKLASNFHRAIPVHLDVVNESQRMEELVQGHDLVVSMLPYTMHPRVADLCINHGKNFVTASYVSPAISALHERLRACEAGVSIVMEVGLDPGIDHMLAMQCFEDIQQRGGKVTSFVSWCGGLPAPEDSDNPLKYKFSWSPVGVLLSAMNGSRCLRDGRVVEMAAGGDNYMHATQPVKFMPGFRLEGFPNRDSIKYKGQYGIEEATTVFRGTLRYEVGESVVGGMRWCGWGYGVFHNPIVNYLTMNVSLQGFADCHSLMKISLMNNSMDWCLRKWVGTTIDCRLLWEAKCGWIYCSVKYSMKCKVLGLLDNTMVTKSKTPLQSLAHHLSTQLSYGPDERDLVVLRHEVIGEFMGRKEEHHIDLVVYGEKRGYTAMAASVGFPCAIAARMLLLNKVESKGVATPLQPAIYKPLLKELRRLGFRPKIKVVES